LDILGVYLLLVAFAGARERKDPLRAGNFLLVELFAVLINLLDSNWLEVTHFWLVYLIVVAESVLCSLPSRVPSSAPARAVRTAPRNSAGVRRIGR
jgi:hypothetical protein